jgi:preprotein translocase subunit YajC
VHTSLGALSLAHLGGAIRATSTAASSSGKGGSAVPFLVLLGLFGIAYVAFLRPARKRQRAALEQQRDQDAARRTATVGDEVTTTAGLLATVVAVDDEYLTLEVAPGVHCRYVPGAILRVNRDDEDGDSHAAEADGTDDRSTHEAIEAPSEDATDPPNETTDGTSSA